MGKRLSYTPRSKVRSALRQLFLRSRERAAAIKRDNYTCQRCGRKKSVAKGKEFQVECHHIHGIGDWEGVIDKVYQEILCHPEYLQTLCPECHQEEKGKISNT
jgi:5-methylcytosine-specific restriction endonuclease McrA